MSHPISTFLACQAFVLHILYKPAFSPTIQSLKFNFSTYCEIQNFSIQEISNWYFFRNILVKFTIHSNNRLEKTCLKSIICRPIFKISCYICVSYIISVVNLLLPVSFLVTQLASCLKN